MSLTIWLGREIRAFETKSSMDCASFVRNPVVHREGLEPPTR